MATRPFEIKIADKDIKAILSTFKNMDDIAKEDMKKTSRDIANDAASAIGSALQATKQGQALARSIKVSNSFKRGPVISIGGDNPKLSTDYVGYRQFQPRSPREGRGNAGYFIFPTLKALQPYITKRWVDEVDRIRREWRERN